MPIIGIDLGTTFSAASYVDDQGRVVVIPMGDEQTLPSVVLIRNDQVIVGEAAMNEWITDEDHVVRWIKRSIGDRDYQYPRTRLFSGPWPAGADRQTLGLSDELRDLFASNGRPLSEEATLVVTIPGLRWIVHEKQSSYVLLEKDGSLDVYEGMSAVDISAEILKAVKAYAEQALGQAVTEVVITCPAYFNALEIENTKRAGELAGFTVVREIIKEPVAAAVHYGVDHMKEGQKTLVCDLGGGTFDATVLTLEKGVFTPVTTMGDRHLGGHDWTEQLEDLVAERCRQLFQDDPRDDTAGRQVLYENCEKAKRNFKRLPTQTILCRCGGKMQQVTVTREEFETRTEPLINRMIMRCQESLKKANLSWDRIDAILMVGGSSGLRRMAEALTQESGKEPVLSSAPDLAVTCGAAIMAKGSVRTHRPASALMATNPLGLTTVAWSASVPRSLGTRAYDPGKKLIGNALIIPRDVEVPTSRSNEDFEISRNGQAAFDIPIVEFEDDVNYDVIRNYRFKCLADAKRGQRIRVTFHYDRSGILTAEACHLESGQALPGEERPYEEPQLTEVEICVKPRWVVFALDTSGSMYGDKISNAKRVLLDQSRTLIEAGGGGCKVGVVRFSTRAHLVCEPTDDLHRLEGTIARIGTEGSTGMDQGIDMAVDQVERAPSGTDRDVVLLTDGYPDRRDHARRAADRARGKGVTLSALSIGQDAVDEDYLKTLTPLTLQVKSAQEIGAGVSTLLSMASSYRSQLTSQPV